MSAVTISKFLRVTQQLLRSVYAYQAPVVCRKATPCSASTSRLQGFCTSSQSPPEMTAGEGKLSDVLRRNFPQATDIRVEDVSGGCGAMFQVYVEAPDFKGKRVVQQHRMVTEALQQEIENMHGLTIQTALSPNQ